MIIILFALGIQIIDEKYFIVKEFDDILMYEYSDTTLHLYQCQNVVCFFYR